MLTKSLTLSTGAYPHKDMGAVNPIELGSASKTCFENCLPPKPTWKSWVAHKIQLHVWVCPLKMKILGPPLLLQSKSSWQSYRDFLSHSTWAFEIYSFIYSDRCLWVLFYGTASFKPTMPGLFVVMAFACMYCVAWWVHFWWTSIILHCRDGFSWIAWYSPWWSSEISWWCFSYGDLPWRKDLAIIRMIIPNCGPILSSHTSTIFIKLKATINFPMKLSLITLYTLIPMSFLLEVSYGEYT